MIANTVLRRRRGGAMIVILVCLAVAATVMLSLTRLAVANRRTMEVEAWQLQARWLVESSLERAAARLAVDSKYAGETWSIAAATFQGRDGAVVRIRVETVPNQPARRLVRAEADFPDDPQLRVRQAKQVVVEIPSPGEKS